MAERSTSGDSASAGRLVIVGTPIGNLADLSERGREALSDADLVVCEDSRRTGQLLSHLGLSGKKKIVANDHTESSQTERIVSAVAEGSEVVLVSDAGMPTVSDPGRLVVAAIVSAGLEVGVVPGPTAAMSALSVSGFTADRFVFEGFLPRKGVERGRRLAELAQEQRTVVLYEAPHRLTRTVGDLIEVRGESAKICVGREVTKWYEEIIHGTLLDVRDRFTETEPRGEFVLVLEGAPVVEIGDSEVSAMLEACRDEGLSRRDAVDEVVGLSGKRKRQVYSLALAVDF